MCLLTVVVNSSADHFEIILRNVANYIGLHFGLHSELHSELHATENEFSVPTLDMIVLSNVL